MVETILKIKEAMNYCDCIRYVYPTDSESYYINSNISKELEIIECQDGYFYGVVSNKWLRCIRKYNFHSPTWYLLHRKLSIKKAIENGDESFEEVCE